MGLDQKRVVPESKLINKVEDDIDEESEDEGKKLEDVRMSNFAYSQTKISEYISFYFASLGVGCAMVASEMANSYNDNGQTNEWIFIM